MCTTVYYTTHEKDAKKSQQQNATMFHVLKVILMIVMMMYARVQVIYFEKGKWFQWLPAKYVACVYFMYTLTIFYTVPLPSILLNLQGPEDQEVMTS